MKLTLDTDKNPCYIFYTATFPKWNERKKRTMSASFLIQTICEFLVATFLIWGLFNEQKLIDFEDKIIAKWKARKSKKIVYLWTKYIDYGKDKIVRPQV